MATQSAYKIPGMNGFGATIIDVDCCDCALGRVCRYHVEHARRTASQARARMKALGWDPDACIAGLEELLLAITCCDRLSTSRKKDVLAVVLKGR